MKTLHLTNAWHKNSGGIATFYRALFAQASAEGRQIRLVVPGAKDDIEDISPTARVYYVAAPTAPLNSNYRVLYPSAFLRPGTRIQEIIRDEKPELVEICDKYNLNYLGALLRHKLVQGLELSPVVIGLSCERMDANFGTYLSNNFLARRFCRWYMRWIYYPFFDHHIAVSEHTADELRQVSVGHKVRRGTWVHPMGVDSSGFSPELRSEESRRQLKRDVGAGDNASLLIYAGRLDPEKNLPLLFDTLLQLKSSDCHLIIAGEGLERASMVSRAQRELPGRVSFLGHIAGRGQLAKLIANCDVFVHPNPREPFGIAPLEAMASGVPVVAPNSGGITSFANAENASLVEPTGESFAAAVRELLGNQELWNSRRAAGRATSERLSWPAVAASMLRLYDKIYQIQLGQCSQEECPPLFWSQPPTGVGGGLMPTLAAKVADYFVSAAYCRPLTAEPRREPIELDKEYSR